MTWLRDRLPSTIFFAVALLLSAYGGLVLLLGRGGTLLGNPRHYRDPHTDTIMEEAFARVPKAEIFRQTGIQFMRFNSLFQLLAMQRAGSPLLDVAETLLFMPDLFHYLFTGVARAEFSIASTSQLYDPRKKQWAAEIPMTRIPGPFLEYACHEGNYAMTDILGGARKLESEAGKK